MKSAIIATVVLATCIYASISPLSYGAFLLSAGHFISFISVIVGIACILLFVDFIRLLPGQIYIIAFATILTASLLGFFIHFQDSGESGPLPFEWLNNYWIRSFPLLIASVYGHIARKQPNEVEQGAAANP